MYIYSIYIFFLCIFCFREHVQCKTRHAFETNFDCSTIYLMDVMDFDLVEQHLPTDFMPKKLQF